MRTNRRLVVAAVAASLVAALAGCAGSSGAAPTQSSAAPTSKLSGELTIFAAASLKNAFDAISAKFEQQNPGVDILPIVYDGSSTLVTQLTQGAAADVFASADEANMKKVTDAGLASDPQDFATNTLVIVMPKGNPGNVQSLQDLSNPKLDVVLCAPQVPCGAAAQTLLKNQGVTVHPASLEQNVTAVLTKVESGDADAGLVYVTDAKSDANVESIVPEGASDVVNTYPIVALKGAKNPDVAAAFVSYVVGPDGQAVLKDLGFGAP